MFLTRPLKFTIFILILSNTRINGEEAEVDFSSTPGPGDELISTTDSSSTTEIPISTEHSSTQETQTEDEAGSDFSKHAGESTEIPSDSVTKESDVTATTEDSEAQTLEPESTTEGQGQEDVTMAQESETFLPKRKTTHKLAKVNRARTKASKHVSKSKKAKTEDESMEDEIIPAVAYREPGCPIVAERNNFHSDMFAGEWKIPFGSMNWLGDLGASLYKRDPKVKEIKNMCLSVNIKALTPGPKSNATFEVDWKCNKKKVTMANKCWPQGYETKSKFECYFPAGDFHAYLMVAATDSKTWMLLVRCKIGEGMGWVILSRTEKLHPDTAAVIFGVLEGYGFDLPSYKFEYSYKNCK